VSTPRHRLIWNAIVTRLQGITVANGYTTNVRTVVKSPGTVGWTNIAPHDRPWIGVIAQSRFPTAEPRRWRERAVYDLVCLLTASSEADKYNAVDALEDDIRKAIGTDMRWGTNPDDNDPNAVMTNIIEVKTDDITEPLQGALIMTIEVTYYREFFA